MKYVLPAAVMTAAAFCSIIGCRINTPPVVEISPWGEIEVNNGEMIEFSADITDPDQRQEISIQWYIDDSPVIGATTDSFTFSAPLISSDTTVTVKAVAEDEKKDSGEASAEVEISSAPYAHLKPGGEFTYSLDLGNETKDVYFIFTKGIGTDGGEASISANFTPRTTDPLPPPPPNLPTPMVPIAVRGTPEVSEFNNDPPAFGSGGGSFSRSIYAEEPGEPLLDTEGVAGNFSDRGTAVAATCRKVVSGNGKTLNIWVADNCWDGYVGMDDVDPDVTSSMIDTLAAKFLTPGDNNDIYEWISGIYGEEWGGHGYSNLIAANNEITIVLYDIMNDGLPASGEGRVVGLFDGVNNYKASADSRSNERIMFFIDAPLFADDTGGGGWSVTDDFWPREVISTLAHELQHMIHFYQKQVKHGTGGTDTWLNEMCSLIAEDLVSNKISADGPRGVSYSDGSAGPSPNTADRLSRYNYYNDESLIYWPPSGSATEEYLIHYSLSYSFGAYLARNYGGPALFQNIVQNSDTDYDAVKTALLTTGNDIGFNRVLQRWGTAVLLSDRLDAPEFYRYNRGDFFSYSHGGITYKAGSINLYNYQFTGSSPQQLGPKIYSGGTAGQSVLQITSNTFYLAGNDLSGKKSWDLSLPEGVKMSAVFK